MVVEGFYKLLAFIDYLVYSLASTMISVIIDIAGKEIFRPEQIEKIADRIYVVVGILMLFKLVISAVQYMINPDSFDDKEKGLSGILKKSIISIGLMVLAPAIFNFMVTMQNSIIETIPRIVFGTEVQDSQKTSDDMAFTVLSSFIKPNGNKGGSVGPNGEIHNLESFREKAAEGCGGGLIGSVENCKYNYMVIISTIAGGFLCYVLMSMSLDVAIRTIKFSLIRVLAPIPISGYIFSKDRLNKFVKTTLTVYFDLFIRLAVIYFIIFAVEKIIDSKMLENIAGSDDWFRNAVVNVAIIGGLFMFAKTAPKFISELLGLPDIGAGDMKDMFKPAWQRYGGMAGAALNPIRTAAGNALTSWQQGGNLRGNKSWWKTTKRIGRAIGAGARGLGEGTIDSAQGLAAGDDWSKMRQRMKNRDTKSFKKAYEANYYRTLGRKEAAKQKLQNVGVSALSFIGQTPVNSAGYSDAASKLGSLRSESFTGRAKSEVDKAPAMFRTISTSTAGLTGGALQLNANAQGIGRNINTTFSVSDAAGNQFNDCDYEKLHNLFIKIQNSNATAADYAAFTYTDANGHAQHFTAADASVVSDIHERVGKKAYSEYVDIAVAAQKRIDASDKLPVGDPNKLSNAERAQLVGLADREVLDRIERFKEAIGALNIKASEKEKLFADLEADPGKFLAGANKIVQAFSTTAAKLGKMEQAAASDKKS